MPVYVYEREVEMRGRAVLVSVSVVVGMFAGSIVGGVPGVTADTRYVVRCLSEQFNATNPNITIHNPSPRPVKIKQLALSNSGAEVNIGGAEFTLGGKDSTTINYQQNAIAVMQYTTKSKILVDGFVYYANPLGDDHADLMRQIGCFGV